MDVMAKLKEAIDILDEIDRYHETLVDRLSELDLKQQDLLHYVEFNKINILWCYNMLKQLKAIRIERRKIKNDMSLLQKFNDIKNRLSSKDSRNFILAELHKVEKMISMPYKGKQYSEEDIHNILWGVVKNNQD